MSEFQVLLQIKKWTEYWRSSGPAYGLTFVAVLLAVKHCHFDLFPSISSLLRIVARLKIVDPHSFTDDKEVRSTLSSLLRAYLLLTIFTQVRQFSRCSAMTTLPTKYEDNCHKYERLMRFCGHPWVFAGLCHQMLSKSCRALENFYHHLEMSENHQILALLLDVNIFGWFSNWRLQKQLNFQPFLTFLEFFVERWFFERQLLRAVGFILFFGDDGTDFLNEFAGYALIIKLCTFRQTERKSKWNGCVHFKHEYHFYWSILIRILKIRFCKVIAKYQEYILFKTLPIKADYGNFFLYHTL